MVNWLKYQSIQGQINTHLEHLLSGGKIGEINWFLKCVKSWIFISFHNSHYTGKLLTGGLLAKYLQASIFCQTKGSLKSTGPGLKKIYTFCSSIQK